MELARQLSAHRYFGLALLQASHAISWNECESDADRLDVHNGFPLSTLSDAAFDSALVTFGGSPKFSANLSEPARAAFRRSADR